MIEAGMLNLTIRDNPVSPPRRIVGLSENLYGSLTQWKSSGLRNQQSEVRILYDPPNNLWGLSVMVAHVESDPVLGYNTAIYSFHVKDGVGVQIPGAPPIYCGDSGDRSVS